jgi:hypothetical protein
VSLSYKASLSKRHSPSVTCQALHSKHVALKACCAQSVSLKVFCSKPSLKASLSNHHSLSITLQACCAQSVLRSMPLAQSVSLKACRLKHLAQRVSLKGSCYFPPGTQYGNHRTNGLIRAQTAQSPNTRTLIQANNGHNGLNNVHNGRYCQTLNKNRDAH